MGDHWDLSPDQKTHLITGIIKLLILLIMRQADRVCANLPDESQILPVLLLRQGIAHMVSVLMPGNALELDMLSV